MTRAEILKGVVVAGIVFVFVFIVVAGLLTLRRGFSARNNPSSMEVFVARTTRKMAMPAQGKTQGQPDSEHSRKPGTGASTLGGPLCDLPRQQWQRKHRYWPKSVPQGS